MAYNSTFFSCSLPSAMHSTHSVRKPGDQFAPLLSDPADRCTTPPARGSLHNPCEPCVAPELSLRRPPSIVSGHSMRPQKEGESKDVLSSLPQHHPFPIAADPLNQLEVLCPGPLSPAMPFGSALSTWEARLRFQQRMPMRPWTGCSKLFIQRWLGTAIPRPAADRVGDWSRSATRLIPLVLGAHPIFLPPTALGEYLRAPPSGVLTV